MTILDLLDNFKLINEINNKYNERQKELEQIEMYIKIKKESDE